MELGVVGKPNVGKSTFFAAATLATVQIANYPFTTVQANHGVAYVRKKCPHLELGRACKPNNAPCAGGTRLIPVEMLDVAGLVPKAHEGRGLGNQFLDDLRQASALIHVLDATGGTDFEGNAVPPGSHDPKEDVRFLAANKADLASPDALDGLSHIEGYRTIPTSAEYELALRRAATASLISYEPGASSFQVIEPTKLTPNQSKALDTIASFLQKHGSTGVQPCLEEAVFKLLNLIVVFPVEDEHHWTDKNGN